MQNIANSWQRYQVTRSRRDLHLCLTHLYLWGKRVCRRRYWDWKDAVFSDEDVLHHAILQLFNYIRSDRVVNERHLVALFQLCCKAAHQQCWRQSQRTTSLNAPLKVGEDVTLEEFIASKLIYSTPESDEIVQQINTVLASFNSDERQLIEAVWLDGEPVKEVAKATNKSMTAVEKVLFKAKSKTVKQLIDKKCA